MSTIACLRIAVGKEIAGDDIDALAALVAKVAGAYLETTWLWPRRFGLVAPFAFVLADPRATRLDARELQALAANLQVKLFGTKGVGEVCLLMLEGDKTEVMRFAGAQMETLQALLDGVDDGSFTGRICKITEKGVVSVAPAGGPVDGIPTREELAALPAPPAPPSPGIGWRGIYNPSSESFMGSGLAGPTNGRGDPVGEGDDPFALERDLASLRALCEAAPAAPGGMLFTGFAFSSLVRASVRAALKPALETLPSDQRRRLGATVRQVPREPSYGGLAELLRLLDPYFAVINLQTGDPQFRIDCIPGGRVGGVTLALSGADERVRLQAIRRFLGAAEPFRANKVWQGVNGLRNSAEVELCRSLKARFITGAAVSDLLRTPVGELPMRLELLPYAPTPRRVIKRDDGWREMSVFG